MDTHFDKTTKIKLEKKDIDTKLIHAFLGNDPYHPWREIDAELWEEFTYWKANELVLSSKGVDQHVMMLIVVG